MKKSVASTAVGALAVVVLAGCGSEDANGADDAAESSSHITVFAAASLKTTFTELGDMYESQNPGSTVDFDFAGSSTLVSRLDQGASADVFASADEANMTKAVDANLVKGDPQDFASNTLTIVTTPGNPKNISTLSDLTGDGLLVVTCAPQVPCGSATEKVEEDANVDITPVSEEASVTDVLDKVTSGQADAGLVYVTDAAVAGDKVTAVPFPESDSAVNTYPISVLEGTGNASAAEGFVDLVLSDEGQAVLAEAGFAKP
ncbi:molybdate ABC transporter substrate-binding protein [Rhodococcus sp. NPDC058521]|uniref:molybdate ABC transporter substrate-binding protein n=1 Tax=Rhodococcus sp. NPDC058521 TaxID=3346536 RepID=UPI003661949F